MRKLVIIHMLLGIPGGMALLASFIMAVLKFGGFGSGAELSWLSIFGTGLTGLFLILMDVYFLFGGLFSGSLFGGLFGGRPFGHAEESAEEELEPDVK
jgi:hypothetical protein